MPIERASSLAATLAVIDVDSHALASAASPGALTTPHEAPVSTTSWTCISCAHDSAKSSHGCAEA